MPHASTNRHEPLRSFAAPGRRIAPIRAQGAIVGWTAPSDALLAALGAPGP